MSESRYLVAKAFRLPKLRKPKGKLVPAKPVSLKDDPFADVTRTGPLWSGSKLKSGPAYGDKWTDNPFAGI